jgi:hypothetical protein
MAKSKGVGVKFTTLQSVAGRMLEGPNPFGRLAAHDRRQQLPVLDHRGTCNCTQTPKRPPDDKVGSAVPFDLLPDVTDPAIRCILFRLLLKVGFYQRCRRSLLKLFLLVGLELLCHRFFLHFLRGRTSVGILTDWPYIKNARRAHSILAK